MLWLWLRAIFLRINLFWTLISFSLSAFSVFLGIWWRNYKQKSAERTLGPKKERVFELSSCIVAEYDFKFKLIKKIVNAILLFENDPVVELTMAMDLIKLKDAWSNLLKEQVLEKKFSKIASFEYLSVKIVADVQLCPKSLEHVQLQALFGELRKCERRIKIYRKCYNDAVRIFNAAFFHFQNIHSNYNFLTVISED